MGFLQRLSEDRSYWTGPYTPKTYTRDPALKNLFGAEPVYAGVPVDEHSAFTFSAVFDAVNQISSDVGKLPKNLRKRRKEGGSDVYIESKVYWLLKYRANPEMTAPVFWRTIIAHALTCKGGFAEIVRDQLGRPAELWIITPDRVQAHRKRLADGTLGPLGWKIDGKEDTIIPDADMLHIHGLGYDGINGYGVIAMARQTIGLALAAERFGAQYFGRGTMFGGHLAVTDELDADQKKELIEGIKTLRMQQDAAFRVMITDASSKFTQFTNKPSESQMDETRVSQVLEVARFFRMPPVRLGVTIPGAVSYASVEISNQEYYTGALLDWITMAEAECWAKLIPVAEKAIQYVKFNANVFLRGDSKARSDFYGVMLDRGVFCADDVLELEDMNPQPNGQGKMYLVQSAQVPKDQLKDLTAARIKQDETPPPPPQAPVVPPSDEEDDNEDQDRERLRAAEEALDEARTALDTERTARVDAEATGRATAEELALRRTSELEAATALARLTAVVEQLRADLAARDAAIVETTGRAAALAQELEGARADLAETAEAVSLAAREAESARASHTEAAVALEAALARVADAEALVATAGADRSAATAALETAQRELREAQARTETAEAARADLEQHAESLRAANTAAETHVSRLQAELETAAAEAVTLRASVEAAEAEVARSAQAAVVTDISLAQLRADLAAAQGDLAARETDLATLREAERATPVACTTCGGSGVPCADCPAGVALTAAMAERDASRTAVSELETRISTAETALAESRQALETGRQATRDRMLATIAAHRGLFVDAMGRMTRREAAQARTKQATPAKLRRWLEDFASVQIPICVESLVPAMRTHLAWTGSDADPVEAATIVAREHLAKFTERLREVIDGPAEEFHGELETVLARWESDRAGMVADAILAEEVRHVGR